MGRTLCFALGNIWRWNTSKNRNGLLDRIRNLDVSGVELTLPTRDELRLFQMSKRNELWLKGLDFVSVHAPFQLLKDSEDQKEIIKQIEIISKLYRQLDADNVVIHPEGSVRGFEILDDYGFQVSIENLPRKCGIPFSQLGKIFKRHPRFKLCLDVSHAYTWSMSETAILIDSFRDRISQLHFSGTYRRKEHQSLRRVSRRFMDSLRPVMALDVPVVVEEDIRIESMEYVKEELDFIKGLFASPPPAMREFPGAK